MNSVTLYWSLIVILVLAHSVAHLTEGTVDAASNFYRKLAEEGVKLLGIKQPCQVQLTTLAGTAWRKKDDSLTGFYHCCLDRPITLLHMRWVNPIHQLNFFSEVIYPGFAAHKQPQLTQRTVTLLSKVQRKELE